MKTTYILTILLLLTTYTLTNARTVPVYKVTEENKVTKIHIGHIDNLKLVGVEEAELECRLNVTKERGVKLDAEYRKYKALEKLVIITKSLTEGTTTYR